MTMIMMMTTMTMMMMMMMMLMVNPGRMYPAKASTPPFPTVSFQHLECPFAQVVQIIVYEGLYFFGTPFMETLKLSIDIF